MNVDEIWNLLSGITIGSIVEWCIVLGCIISTICAGAIKLYKVFHKYTDMKDENNELKQLVQKHDRCLNNIETCLKNIQNSLSEQKEVNLKQVRSTIVHICDEAIANNTITAGKLKSLEELYEEYVTLFHGNGYIKVLVDRVRELQIIGKIEE